MAIATRQLGRTGRVVSELGFGCSGVWAQRWIDDAAAISLVHEAVKLGITVFDTGHSYGDGRSERRLGTALRALGPAAAQLTVSTKVGTVRVGRQLMKDFSPDSIEAQVAESLERIGLERLPLLFLHGPDPVHLSDDLLDTLSALKGEGVVELIGVNGVEHQVAAALQTGLFDVIMPTYNPVHRAGEKLIRHAAQAGVGVMAASPLGRMAFAPMDADWTLPGTWWTGVRRLRDRLADGGRARRAGQLGFLSQIEGWTAAQASLGFVLANPDVHCAVFSTANLRHLHANAAASGRSLPEAALRRIRAVS